MCSTIPQQVFAPLHAGEPSRRTAAIKVAEAQQRVAFEQNRQATREELREVECAPVCAAEFPS